MSTKYKFYKTTCTAGSIDTTSATKNPFKLDEVENGGIVLAVDNTSNTPNFGRMYFKNPFGTAYDTDGKLFEVGTNVSTLNVHGINSSSSDLGNGRIRIESATYNTCIYPDQMYIKDKSANESVVISKGNIQFTNANSNANGTISADANLTLNSPGANLTLNSSTLTITGSVIGNNNNITFNGSITTNTQVNTDNIYPKTTNGKINLNSAVDISDGLTVGADLTVTGINTVGTRVSIGDVVAPAVNWQGNDVNSASGVHVWHNKSAKVYGVSIVGATDAGGVYPQIRVYDGTPNNVCKVSINGEYGDIKVSRNISADGAVNASNFRISSGGTVVSFNSNGSHQLQGTLAPVPYRGLDIGSSNYYITNLFSEHIYSKKGSLITFTPSGTTYTSDSSSVGTGLLAVFITVGQNNDKTYEITMFIPAVDSPYYYDFRGESGDGAWVKAKISNNRLILDITALSAIYPVSNVAAYQILRVS